MKTETAIAFILLATSLATSGCVGWQIDSAISRYRKAAPAIQLGDSQEKVLTVLMPTQEGVSAGALKSQDAFKQGNDTIEFSIFVALDSQTALPRMTSSPLTSLRMARL